MSEENSGKEVSDNRQDYGLRIGLEKKETPSKRVSHKFSKSTRRGILKLLSSIGASGTLVKGLSKTALAKESKDPTKKVPYTEKYRASQKETLGSDSHTELQAKAASMPHDKWKYIKAAKREARN